MKTEVYPKQVSPYKIGDTVTVQQRLVFSLQSTYLPKGPFADERVDLVSIVPFFAGIDDVIVVGIVIAFIEDMDVDLVFLVSALVPLRGPLSTPLLLGVVHL